MYIAVVLFFMAFFLQMKTWGFFDLANPVVMFFNYHLFFMCLGVFVYWIDFYPSYKVNDITIILVLLSYVISLASSLLVFIFFPRNRIFNVGSISRFNFSKKPNSVYFFIVWCFGILSFLLYTYFTNFNALYFLLKGYDVENIRVESQAGMGFISIPAQLMTIIGGIWLVSNPKNNFLIKVIVFLITIIILLSFGFRSAVAFFLVGFFILETYTSKTGLAPWKIISACFSIFFLMVFMVVLRQASDNVIGDFSSRVFWRSFVTIINLDMIVSDYDDHLYGLGLIMDLSVVLPGAGESLGSYLKNYFGMVFSGGGITPSYIGAGFVDFGIYGAFLYPAIAGIFVSIIYLAWPFVFGRNLYSFIFLIIFSITTSGVAAAGLITPYLYFGLPVLLIAFGYKIFVFLMCRYSYRMVRSD